MTVEAVLAITGLAVGTSIAGWIAAREARATGVGWAHPAAVWLAIHVVTFGIGSVVLAAGGRPASAAFVAGGFAAFAAGVVAVRAVGPRHSTPTTPPAPPPTPLVSLPRAALLAAIAVAAVVPILATAGIPFLTRDITGARTELAGLIVQPLRVFVPALALAVVLRAAGASAGPGRRVVAASVIAALLGGELLLASRYLLAELVATVVLGWLIAGGRLPIRALAAAAFVGIAAFGGIQLARAWDLASARPIAFVVDRTVSRVIMIQPRTMDALMRAIPASEPFFLGATWARRLGPLLGRDIPNLGYWIYPSVVDDTATPASDGATGDEPGSTRGYAAPGLIGEAWANFGWAGLILPSVAGAGAALLGRWIADRRTTDADVVAGAMVTLFLARTHALGLGGLVVVVVLVVAWRVAVAADGWPMLRRFARPVPRRA